MKRSYKYVIKKEVDWSLLNWGLTLPIASWEYFGTVNGELLKHGERKNIIFALNGIEYDAQICNNNFNKGKYDRKDVIQFRYSKDVAKVVQELFKQKYNYILEKKKFLQPKARVKFVNEDKDYIFIYATDDENYFELDRISPNDFIVYNKCIDDSNMTVSENHTENNLAVSSEKLTENESVKKIIRLQTAIDESLKQMYDYKCQICGEAIGIEIGAKLCEVHYIDSTRDLMNNNYDNMMVLCPNHHKLIETIKPIFNKDKLQYEFANGYTMKLKLNKHL